MLMSAADYRDSLRRFSPRVFVNGERIESVADAASLSPGINAIGVSYDFALKARARAADDGAPAHVRQDRQPDAAHQRDLDRSCSTSSKPCG